MQLTLNEQIRLVDDCIREGVHFTRTVRYIGENIDRCHGCGCPRGWRPPARRLTAPTGRPVPMIEPTGMRPPRQAPPVARTIAEIAGPLVLPQPCGTRAAAMRHRKRGETPCDPCLAAEAAYARKRRAAA